MRIHTLTLSNLNSLYGEHTVSFDGALGSAGLFLIHGPMGAGKTTLLDAICLALYGATPRLVGGREAESFQVMSRGEWNCRAQVEFSMVEAGGQRVRYRATWRIWRAYAKDIGAPQDPERTLERMQPSGAWDVVVQTQGKREAEAAFAGVLQGLSFDQFQRTVLLAQFAFRQFLDADEATRAGLLSRLTDGARFRAIGLRATEQVRALKLEKQRLEGALSTVSLLSAEEEAATRAALEAATAEAAQRTAERDAAAARTRFWDKAKTFADEVARESQRWAAAQAEHAEHADALSTLARDEALAPAREALSAARQAEVELEVKAREQASLQQADADARAAHAEAEAARRGAQSVEQAARTQRDAAAPELAAADAAWEAARHAAQTAGAAQQAQSERARSAAQVRQAVDVCLARHAQVTEAREAARAALETVPHHAHLPEALAKLSESGRALKQAEQDAQAVAARRDEAAAELEVTRQALETLHAEGEALQRARAEEQLKSEQANAHLAAVLSGATLESARRAIALGRQALTRRIDATDRYAALEVRRAERAVEHAGLTTQAREAVEAATRALGARDAAVAEVTEATQTLEVARLAHLSADKAMHTHELRALLGPGAACTLCGSTDHPYIARPESAPSLDALEVARAEAERTLQGAELRVDRARAAEQSTVAEAARADALAKSAANALVAHAQSVADLDAQAAREAEGAQYDGGRPLAAFAEGLRAEAAAVDGREAVLNDADSAARAATAALGDALQRAQSHADQSQAARTQLTQSQHKRDAAAEELARRTTALETERRGVLDALRAIDILDDDVHVGLTTLQARALRVAEARARLSDADAAFAQADDALKAAQSQWAAAELELTNATTRVDTAREAEVAARAAAQSYLGGVHPAEVRGQLEGALAAAHAALVAHAERVSQAQAAAARAEERLGHATAAVETAQAAALAARVARDGAFDACGVADAASVEAASLDAGQRAALTTLRTRLMSALTEAESRYRSQSESLSAHWATRPAGEQGELEEAAARLEDAQAVYAAADAALQAAMAHAATASHQLAAHEAALIAQQATLARAKVVEAELRIVEDIAKLIGTNDGAGFEKIVQALNLQSLLVRANARLARFLDRYQLEQIVEHRGAPRLDFRVVDLHQSGVRRTIKSLSGGESFIVSMALALGLADLRSSKLSIETLLIDEGFGTVDPSTLKDIVKVLEALRDESGTQIGVISHVEAMREMVPAQIEVKSVGVGRSTLVLHC